MSQFRRIFSGKFQYLRNCAGVKHLTNIMSDWEDFEKVALRSGGSCFYSENSVYSSAKFTSLET